MVWMMAMPLFAQPDSLTCDIDKYERYASAQEAWQQDLARLIVTERPEFRAVSRVLLHDQLRKIEMAKIAVREQLVKSPTRVATNMPLNQWLSLSREDRSQLAPDNRRYAALMADDDAARYRKPHPDGDRLRAFMRSTLMVSPAYLTLQKQLMQSVEAAEAIRCD